MNAELEKFLADPALATKLGSDVVQQLADALAAIDREADHCGDALEMLVLGYRASASRLLKSFTPCSSC
jgi:hypothetical protein